MYPRQSGFRHPLWKLWPLSPIVNRYYEPKLKLFEVSIAGRSYGS